MKILNLQIQILHSLLQELQMLDFTSVFASVPYACFIHEAKHHYKYVSSEIMYFIIVSST